MLMFDVNVLVNAFRSESPDHEDARRSIEAAVNGDEVVALPSLVLSGFLRVVTHPRVFDPPTRPEIAVQVVELLRAEQNVVVVQPGPGHWDTFVRLCSHTGARGNLVPDAYLAAMAIEQRATFVSLDSGFARFDGLSWRSPRAV